MKLGKYIQHLLTEHETVIIPGFGAFITVYKPAEINKESGEIKPPSKEITFNQKIRNNDGLLVATVAEKEGISHFEALQKIEQERENILYELDKGEKVVLKNIGEIQYDSQHNIQFNSFENDNLLLDAFGLETASPAMEIPEEPEEGPKQEEVETEPDIVSSVEEETAEKEPEETDFSSEGEYVTEPPADEKQGRKKKRVWLYFLLILIPLIAVGVFMIRKDIEKIPLLSNRNETPVVPEIVPEKADPLPEVDTNQPDTTEIAGQPDSAAIQSQPDSIIQKENDNLTDKYLEPDPSKFYLVAGSFKEKKNADKFLAELENEGHNPFHLGKQGNFYIIGLGEYNTEQQAFTAQDDFLEQNPQSGVWIYQVD